MVLTCFHTVASHEGAGRAKDVEQQKNDGGWVHVEGVPARSSDVDHGVKGRQEELGGIDVCARRGCSGDGTGPDLALKSLGLFGGFDRLWAFGDLVKTMLANCSILAEILTESRLGDGRKQIKVQIGCANVVCLFDDELAVAILAGDRS